MAPASTLAAGSVGSIETQYLDLPEPVQLDNGRALHPIRVAYETYGTLSPQRDNVILVCHALSGDAHAAGFSKTPPEGSTRDGFAAEDRDGGAGKGLGWWDGMIGPGKAFDTDHYFVVSTNLLGGCRGTTGPSSIDPATGKPYGSDFPVITVADMVRTERAFLDVLGIERLAAVAGGSLGGMQALQWAVSYPDMMDSVVPIIPLARTPAWTTGVLEMLRQSIMADPRWKGGNYDAADPPEQGMRLWAGWLSGVIVRTPVFQEESFPKGGEDEIRFLKGVEDGGWKRMDALDWVYQSWAYDQHDVGNTPGFNGDYNRALGSIRAKTLILAGSTDLLNPEYESMQAARQIPGARFVSINAERPLGHLSGAGATAKENEVQNREIAAFLAGLGRR